MKTFYIIIIFFLLSTNILLSDKYDKEYLKAIEYSNNNEYDNRAQAATPEFYSSCPGKESSK